MEAMCCVVSLFQPRLLFILHVYCQMDKTLLLFVPFLLTTNRTKPAAAAAVTVFVVQTLNYSTVPTFISLSLHVHTHMHTHTDRLTRMHIRMVYYHLSLCDSTEQQELYTLIKQATCQCIYNHF